MPSKDSPRQRVAAVTIEPLSCCQVDTPAAVASVMRQTDMDTADVESRSPLRLVLTIGVSRPGELLF